MSTPEFAIPIHDLDAAGKAFAFQLSPAWMKRALADVDDVAPSEREGELSIRASRSGNDVIVHGTLKATLRVACARCLEPADVVVDQSISVLMVPSGSIAGSTGADDEYEFSAEEADIIPYSGDTVILDDLVRDELLLQIPMIPLCSETCPGMSPPPGEDDARAGIAEPGAKEAGATSVDPRLAPLLCFRQDK